MTALEEQTILEQTETMSDAWNRGDAKAVASFFAEDGIRIGPDGVESHGREAIAAAYEQMIEQMGGAQVTEEPPAIRLVTPELALVNTYIELKNEAGLAIKGHTLEVWQKIGDRWMLLEAHPKIFPPPL